MKNLTKLLSILIFLSSWRIAVASKAPTLERKFSNQSEASFIITGGNSDLETYNLKSNSSYTFTKNIVQLGGHYSFGKADNIENLKNWDINSSYQRVLSTKFNALFAEKVESNKFSGIKQRYNTDLGAKYKWITKDDLKAFFELAYRYTIDNKIDGTQAKEHKGRVFFQREQKVNKNLSTKIWVEYLHNFSDSDDYQVNFSPSLSVFISDMFSLKFSYEGSYDEKPSKSGSKKYDFIQSTALIANF